MGIRNATRVHAPTTNDAFSRRLASLIASQRRGRSAPEYARRSGRIDRRSLSKIAVGDSRVFIRAGATSAGRTRLVLLLDCSGSMSQYSRGATLSTRAAQMAWDFVTAAKHLPSVTCEAWGHTTGGKYEEDTLPAIPGATEGYGGEKYVILEEVLTPKSTPDSFAKAMSKMDFRGNEDGYAIAALANDVEHRATGERIVFVVISDGAPIYAVDNTLGMDYGSVVTAARTNGFIHVASVVAGLRRKGHAVVSVSIDSGLGEQAQRKMYGNDYVVPYTNDQSALYLSLAKVLGKAMR